MPQNQVKRVWNQTVVIFCKSYAGDLRRVIRLVESIQRYNRDHLPLFISVPANDLPLFKNQLGLDHINWLSDEEIISHQPHGDKGRYASWSGSLSQQVIKSEFWRLNQSENYLCLDSDAEFIKDFHLTDFVNPETGAPYTILCQSKDFLQLAESRGIGKVLTNYARESAEGKRLFGRQGPDYNFSTTPVIWSAKVWRDLASHYLEPKAMDFWDAIAQFPNEMRWYGEALLAYKSIPLQPIEPLFRVYLYDWQYASLKRTGETPEKLKSLFLGMVKQSNWEFELDYGDQAKRKSALSRGARRVRRFMSRYR